MVPHKKKKKKRFVWLNFRLNKVVKGTILLCTWFGILAVDEKEYDSIEFCNNVGWILGDTSRMIAVSDWAEFLLVRTK